MFDQELITKASLLAGILCGSLMIITVCFVYGKHRVFALGGSILTPFGVVLISLSIWKTVEIKVSADGGVEASFQALNEKIEAIERSNLELVANVEHRFDTTEHLLAKSNNRVLSMIDQQKTEVSALEIDPYERVEPVIEILKEQLSSLEEEQRKTSEFIETLMLEKNIKAREEAVMEKERELKVMEEQIENRAKELNKRVN